MLEQLNDCLCCGTRGIGTLGLLRKYCTTLSTQGKLEAERSMSNSPIIPNT